MTMNCKIPSFDSLSNKEISAINSNSYTASYNKKDLIFKQYSKINDIMFINSGLIKIYKEGRQDKNHILRIGSKGDFIGVLEMFSKKQHCYSCVALQDCEIVHVDVDVIRDIFADNGKYISSILRKVTDVNNATNDRLISLTYKQLPGRIADVLLYFAEQIYGDYTFSFPLSRQELAEIAGTTKESFIRTLTEFKNDRIITLSGKKITIESVQIVKTLSKLG